MISTTRIFATLAVLTLLGMPAKAAELVYPPGVRVGLAPLSGLAPAKAFSGLESENDAVKVLMTELPAAAYAEVEAALQTNPAGQGPVKPEPLQTAAGKAFYTVESATVGPDNVKRYSMIFPGAGFSGYVAVQVADKAGAAFSEDAVKGMLATVAVRSDVPVAEQLAMMPFNIADLSDFKTVRMLAPGAAILLGDANPDAAMEKAPFMIIGLMAGVPEKPDDRARFAQQAVAEIPGLREGKITMSEPVRIDGQAGYETRIDAVSGKDNTPVTIVQWLRFGPQTSLRIIGSSPRDDWSKAFTRFRAVRDGIRPRG